MATRQIEARYLTMGMQTTQGLVTAAERSYDRTRVKFKQGGVRSYPNAESVTIIVPDDLVVNEVSLDS